MKLFFFGWGHHDWWLIVAIIPNVVYFLFENCCNLPKQMGQYTIKRRDSRGWGMGCGDGGDGGVGLVVARSRKSTYSSGISSMSMVKSWLDPHGILLDPHKMVETSSYLIWLRFLFGSTKKILLLVNITRLFLVRTFKLSISMVRILKKLPRKKLPIWVIPLDSKIPHKHSAVTIRGMI